MKPVNVFDPFGAFASSPFAIWQSAWETSWKLMDAWQQAWIPLLTPTLPGSGLPLNPLALMPNVVAHDLARSMLGNSPFAAFMPRVEARLTPVGGQDADAARLSMRVHVPGMPGTAAETVAVEALIARQQGRERARLGCLEGVQVVYPATDVAAEPPVAAPTDVTRAAISAARQAKPAPATKKAAARKPAVKKAASGPKTGAV